MPSEPARAYEIASMIESWQVKAARAELLKIKSALREPEPSQSQLSAAFDEWVWGKGRPFSTATFEENEAKRVEYHNQALAAKLAGFEEQYRAQVAQDEPAERPWWR